MISMSQKMRMVLLGGLIFTSLAGLGLAVDDYAGPLILGDREVVATKQQRDALQLNWFMDGNIGALAIGRSKSEERLPTGSFKLNWYGANGSKPVRISGTVAKPLQQVEKVSISTTNEQFRYLAGGPVYFDPESKRRFLFYHAEIHRDSEKNFYSVLGLSVQSDELGLAFTDLGPIYTANVSSADTQSPVELCGAPYVIKDGFFYVYARDVGGADHSTRSNLSVARASVSEVVDAGLRGKNAKWTKYFQQSFSEPALGGRSTPLESNNPSTRWMDVSYNTTLKKFVLIVAANTSAKETSLFYSLSDDGIVWTERHQLIDEDGELFYPSIVGYRNNPRETGREFYLYYTFSKKGGWERWDDAIIVRRTIKVEPASVDEAATR